MLRSTFTQHTFLFFFCGCLFLPLSTRAQTDSLTTLPEEVAVEREVIYQLVRTFNEGRNAFITQGDLAVLPGTTTPAYLEILKIGKEANQIEDIAPRPFVMEAVFSNWVAGDTASCWMRVKNYPSVGLRLAKLNGTWKVCGEKAFYASPEMVKAKREELDILKEKVALKEALQTELSQAVIQFLGADQPDKLQAHSTPAFFQFMEKFKLKFGTYDPTYLQVDGPLIPINLKTKVRIKGDSAVVRNLEESVYFLRENGTWKLAGFNEKFGKDLTDAFLEVQFFNLQDEFRVSYSAFNGDPAQVNLPEPGAEDNTLYHYMTDLLNRAVYPDGPERLAKDIQSHLKTQKSHSPQKSTPVYVACIIEKDGSLSEVKVLESPSWCKGRKVKKALEGISKWEPASQYDELVRMYQVLIVTF